MKQTISLFKVFTDEHIPTLGNPAAVVMNDAMLPVEQMEAIAIWTQQPMTAFISPREHKPLEFDIRYYDMGGRECHICGHATLAAAAHLAQECLRRG